MDVLTAHLQLKFPSALAWSPDEKYLAYQVSGPTGSEIWIYDTTSRASRLAAGQIAPFRLYKDLPDLRWTVDGRLIYQTGRVFWFVHPEELVPQLFAGAPTSGDLAQLSPDLNYLSYLQNGEIWVQSIDCGSARRLTDGEGLLANDWQLFSRLVQRPQWSLDSQHIAYLHPLKTGFEVRIVHMNGERSIEILPEEDYWGYTIVNWSPDSRSLAMARLSSDFRRKRLAIYDLELARENLIWEDRDPLWVDHNIRPDFGAAWSPDSRRLAFLSNRDGWRHLYVANMQSGETNQRTSGLFDCFWCDWSPQGDRIAYVSNQTHLQERRLMMVSPETGEHKQLINRPGVCLGGWYLRQMNFAWSPGGGSIAHVFSGPHDPPQLWVNKVGVKDKEPEVVFDSRSGWLEPEEVMHLEAVSFISSDGMQIHGVLVTPPGLDRTRRYPAVVFAYGAWDQEAQLGWEFPPKNMIFNYLAQKGYVALLVDPRGSESYGHAYAHAQHREGGRLQAADLAAAAQFLERTGFVDAHRLALFGYSYGGYLALQTQVYAPGVFAASISMAPVCDWNRYAAGSPYANLRFGSPDEVPNPLWERSPFYHADRIQGAVLLLHGEADYNVPVSSSQAMATALEEAGKTFELVTYPGEGHVFIQPETIQDLLVRMDRFLAAHLPVS
jgi:dipeptidyl aminopeptidase/acylaminoacyl peptidase